MFRNNVLHLGMKNDRPLYIAPKNVPLHVKHKAARELEAEMPDLAKHVAHPEAEAILIPMILVMKMKDHEFRRFVDLPFTFLMDEKTLKLVQNRMEHLGIAHTPDPINKSITTENNGTNKQQVAKSDTGTQAIERADSQQAQEP